MDNTSTTQNININISYNDKHIRKQIRKQVGITDCCCVEKNEDVILLDGNTNIKEIVKCILGLDENILENIFFKLDGKLISRDYILENYLNDPQNKFSNIIKLECFDRINGGIIDELFQPVFDIITKIFDPIVKPIMGIGQVFIFLIRILVWLGKFIYWLVFFAIWLFTDLLNPINLLTDFWNSIILIVITIVSTVFNTFMGLMAFVMNSVGGWMQGFWGWDQSSLTMNDANSNYFRSFNRNKGKKCYLTNSNKVPFSILLGTILCPPMGVFMDLGITGWFNIFICMILTLLYYIPGLVYALLVIYS